MKAIQYLTMIDVMGRPYTVNLDHVEYFSPKMKDGEFTVVSLKMTGDYAINISAKQWFEVKPYIGVLNVAIPASVE